MDAALRSNMEAQRDRLLDQLADLEECKDDLEQAEYDEQRKETLEQLKDHPELQHEIMMVAI